MQIHHGHAHFLPGIQIWAQSRENLLEYLSDRLKKHSSTMIVTLNPLMVLRANRDDEFNGILEKADVVVCDGQGVRWAFRHLHNESIPLIPGVELAEDLIIAASKNSWKVYLLGGEHDIWQKAKEKFAVQFKNPDMIQGHHGYFNHEEELKIIEEINRFKPDLIIAGMGFPKQEKFLFRNRDKFNDSIMIGVGGSLDVFAGEVKRAPIFFRKLKIEWLWRMFREPERFKNIVDLIIFSLLIITRHKSLLNRSTNDKIP